MAAMLASPIETSANAEGSGTCAMAIPSMPEYAWPAPMDPNSIVCVAAVATKEMDSLNQEVPRAMLGPAPIDPPSTNTSIEASPVETA